MFAGKPTVIPHPAFNARADAEALNKAVVGLGTTEKTIISILAHRSSTQRHAIKDVYKEIYKNELIEDIKDDTSGDFRRALATLLQSSCVNDAEALHYSMKGLGTDESSLEEILFTRSNKELHDIKHAYFQLYKIPLTTAIKDDTSGDFRKLLIAVVEESRDETENVDPAEAIADALELIRVGLKKIGTNVKVFTDIFTTRNFLQLRATFEEYEKLAKATMENTISNEMSGDTAHGFRTLTKIIKNKEAYFAERIYKASKGLGTHDKRLTRAIVSRAEKDLEGIKQQYFILYNKQLEALIAEETSFNYKAVLLELIGAKSAVSGITAI